MRGINLILALTHIPNHNRTAINFVHVNGRSVYIDWRMVVVILLRRNVQHHVKREGKCPGGGNVRENMSGGICLDGNVRIPSTRWRCLLFVRSFVFLSPVKFVRSFARWQHWRRAETYRIESDTLAEVVSYYCLYRGTNRTRKIVSWTGCHSKVSRAT